MTTCLCKDCHKQRTRHPLGLCVLCFLRRYNVPDWMWYDWDWDVEDAA